MRTAKDIMTENPITVAPDDDIAAAVAILVQQRINGLPVVDADGRLVGILCQSDLVAQQKKLPLPSYFTLLDSYVQLSSSKEIERELEKMAAVKVKQAMTPDPVTVAPDTPIEDIATLMVEMKYHSLPVLSAGRLVGIVGKEDVLRTLMPSTGKSGQAG